ncbi:unnamed protein product [Gongylonema pulchrum]|uniref:Uncharacterized protein n=1 Tax=Gongylonema pulchrum TaxID=637853 RepID=A0A183E916_9BILA|nr:unnamed protein product [Gongylonema pulchrum]
MPYERCDSSSAQSRRFSRKPATFDADEHEQICHKAEDIPLPPSLNRFVVAPARSPPSSQVWLVFTFMI